MGGRIGVASLGKIRTINWRHPLGLARSLPNAWTLQDLLSVGRAQAHAAIALFSGAKADKTREIWLVDKAPQVIEKLKTAVTELNNFMASQKLEPKPEAVPNLKGDDARAAFIHKFKEVRRLQTQLDQYTDLTPESKTAIESILPETQLKGFRGAYIETAQRLRDQRRSRARSKRWTRTTRFRAGPLRVSNDRLRPHHGPDRQVFAASPGKAKMSREQQIGLIASDAKFMDERELITDYVRSLESGKKLDEEAVREGYQRFKAERNAKELAVVAGKHGLAIGTLQSVTDTVLGRMVFDGEQLTDLLAPLELSWRERREKELALMDDLLPLRKKLASGREISGLNAYEQ